MMLPPETMRGIFEHVNVLVRGRLAEASWQPIPGQFPQEHEWKARTGDALLPLASSSVLHNHSHGQAHRDACGDGSLRSCRDWSTLQASRAGCGGTWAGRKRGRRPRIFGHALIDDSARPPTIDRSHSHTAFDCKWTSRTHSATLLFPQWYVPDLCHTIFD